MKQEHKDIIRDILVGKAMDGDMNAIKILFDMGVLRTIEEHEPFKIIGFFNKCNKCGYQEEDVELTKSMDRRGGKSVNSDA